MFGKGLILVIIPLISQGLFLGLLVTIRGDQAEAQRLALRARQVIAETDSLSANLAELHSALRGLLITNDPRFTERFLEARKDVKAGLQALELMLEESQGTQREQLRTIEKRMHELFEWHDQLRELIQKKDREAAVALVKTLSGQVRIEAVRAAIRAFLEEEQRLQAERQETLEYQATVQNWVLFGGGVLALVSTALLAAVFARGIAQRLGVLTENTRRMAEGKELLPPLEGEDELAQLDRSFRDMATALEQKNQENEMFVYSVSHDLRSPLVNLQGFSQELAASGKGLRDLLTDADVPGPVRQEALGLIDFNMHESVKFIQNAVTRLSAIIDALLRLSRAGRVEYHWQMVDVRATVERVVAALHGSLTERGAAVVLGELPAAWGDATAVEQIFANLIGNAVNYLDPSRPGKIEVGALPPEDGQAVELRTYYVKDNGLGIPEAHMPKVFIAFQRLHADRAKGEGIGLALVRRVIERHGGRIWLESEAGVGTTFFVALPTSPPDAARA